MPQELAPLRVLLVEDSVDDALLVTDALRRAGFEPLTMRVETASAMRAALAEAAWDAILTDYDLCEFNALAALDLLRESGHDIPILIVSGTIDEADAVAALRAGALDFITKANLARLGPALARELRDAAIRRRAAETQAQLKDQEASFQLLFENNPLPMWVYDEATLAFLEVNRSAVAHYGYSREEFLALKITDIRPPEAVPLLLDALAAEPPDRRKANRHWRHCRKDGQIIDVEITSQALRFRERAAVLVVAHDITERKRVQEAVAASEHRFRALIEKSADGVALIDAQGQVLYTSPATARILGATPEYWVGGDIRNRTHPDEAGAFTAWLGAVLAQPGGSITAELRYRRFDNTWCWLEGTATNLLDEPSVRAIVINFREVTERREREAHIQFQARLLDTVGEAVIATNLEGRIIYWNHFAETLYGWPAEEALGRNIVDVTPSETTREQAAALMQSLRAGHNWSGEFLVRRRDGSTFLAQVTDAPIYDEAGGLAGIIGISTDITERRRAEEALAASEAELRALFAAMNDVIFVLDHAGRFLKIAPTNPKFLLFPPDTVLGRTAHELFAAPAADELVGYIRAALEARAPVHYEYAVPIRGQTVWFDATVSPLGTDTVFYVARDITERKRAEEAVAASERRFRVLIENSADAITLIDDAGTVVYDSPAAPRLLGYSPDEWIGRSALDLVHPADLSYVQQRLQQLAEAPGQPVHAQFRVRHKSGAWRWLEAVASNLLTDPTVHAIVVNYRDITPRRAAEEKIQRQFQYLTALREVDRAITASFDLRLSLSLLLAQVTEHLGVNAAAVLVFNPGAQLLEPLVTRGYRLRANEMSRLRLGEGYAGLVALERAPLHIPNLAARFDNPLFTQYLLAEGFVSYDAVPLLAKGQVRGVLEVLRRTSPGEPDPEWLDFLSTLAEQAAIAIDNATLLDGLQRSNMDLAVAYDATIEGWSRALDLRDKETEGHSQRVTELTLRLAEAMGMSEAELIHVRRGALLHDIGKMGIPDAILLKAGPLTDEEWVIMRRHPTYAFELLAPIAYLGPALDIPYCHHEWWDGTGYPRGLRGEAIPLAARIFAVVDVWDALRSDRPYRLAWPAERVLAHIRALAGTQFDPRVVAAFLPLVE